MSSIGIFDYDFFNFSPVIPNLECAKMLAYFKRKKEITVLTPYLMPEKFSTYYIRKEYEDGNYPQEFFMDNVIYGGKAFSLTYEPMDINIEHIKPDFSPYEQYINRFDDLQKGKRILHSAHCRLSLNGIDIDNYKFDKLIEQNSRGIIFHDYDLAKVEGSWEYIKYLSEECRYTLDGNLKPCAIGNKYPIILNTEEELEKWVEIKPMDGVMFLQYTGFMSPDLVYFLSQKNKLNVRQIYYDITSILDDDFIKSEKVIELFKQVIFFRKRKINLYLIHNKPMLDENVELLIELLNCYWRSSRNMKENSIPKSQTLFKFCASKIATANFPKRSKILTVEDMRKIFAYVREENFELFNAFYQYDNCEFIGGKLIYD